jgi:tight adherence protein B
MMIGAIAFRDLLLGGGVAGFIFGITLAAGTVVAMRSRKRDRVVKERLGLQQPTEGQRVLRLWHEGGEATTVVPTHERPSWWQKLEQARRDSGWNVSLKGLLAGIVAGSAGLAAMLLLVTGNVLLAVAAGLALGLTLWALVRQRIARGQAVFEGQLVDALGLASRSLRAGHPLMAAFRIVSDEMEPPISNIFAEICQQQQLGASLEQSLRRAAAQSSNADMKLFVTAVIIQVRTGGNLSDLMERLATVIRERIRLGRRVRVLTAQTQLSKRVLLVLPMLVLVVLSLVNPKYMEPMYKTTNGQIMLGVAGLLMVLGAWMMNRLSRIKW